MTPLELLQQRKEEIQRIAAKHGAYNVRIFGSVVRGEAEPESDIDLLIEKGPRTSSWFPAGLAPGGEPRVFSNNVESLPTIRKDNSKIPET